MKTNSIFTILTIVSWVLFAGLCVVAGSSIAIIFIALFKPGWMQYTWKEVDLTALYVYDQGHFFAQMTIIAIVTVLKAVLFFLIIKLLSDKKINISQPFSPRAGSIISLSSFVTLLIGLFSHYGVNYAAWLGQKGIAMPSAEEMHVEGGDVWLFMCVILFIIAQVFKKGIELQAESDLTV